MKMMKKVMALTLSCAMVLSVASCSNLTDKKSKKDKDDSAEDVIKVADNFAKGLKNRDADKMLKVCSEDFEDDAEELEDEFDFDAHYDADKATVIKAIAGTVDYEIDEDSAEVDDDEATVDVTFTYADFDSIAIDGFWSSVDDVVAALDDAKTKEVTVTLELEMNDDEDWVVVNPMDAVDDVMKYTNVSFIVNVASLIDLFSDVIYEENVVDPTALYVDLFYTDYEPIYENELQFYYVVSVDGKPVYTSQYLTATETMVYSSLEGAEMDNNHLLAGVYTFDAYTTDDVLITSVDINVEVTSVTETKPTTGVTLPEGQKYVAMIDVTDAFMSGMGINGNLNGKIEIPMYIVLGDEATLVLDGQNFVDAFKVFIGDNLDNIIQMSVGMSVEEAATAMNMTPDELRDYLMTTFEEELNPSDFEDMVQTAAYEIDGNTITIKTDGNPLVGSYEMDAIRIDVSDIDGFEDIVPSGELVFELQQ